MEHTEDSLLTISLGLFISQNEIDSGKIIFSEHLPLSKLQQGIKSGAYLQGTFRASRENYLEATVWVHGDTEDNKEASVYINSFYTKMFSVLFFSQVFNIFVQEVKFALSSQFISLKKVM